MFDNYWDQIEDAVGDTPALDRLAEEVEADKSLSDVQREQLLGLADRYRADVELAGDAAEIAMVDHEPEQVNAGA